MTTPRPHAAKIVLIPESLRAAKNNAQLELWQTSWAPTSGATILDELQARNDLYIERFVRRNVSRAKFEEWKRENPRTFTTTREQEYLKGIAIRQNPVG